MMTLRRNVLTMNTFKPTLTLFAALSVLFGCAGCSAPSNSSSSGAALGAATLIIDSRADALNLDFGLVDCGGEPAGPKAVAIKNHGEGPLRWAATLDSIAYFSLEGATEGTLEVGESAALSIKPGVIPASADAGSVQSADLVVTTDDPHHPSVHVPLSATARGATLELVAPQLADFGQTPLGVASQAIPFTIKNHGNASVKVAVTPSADQQFAFAWLGGDAPVDVAPGGTMAGLAATFTATSANASNSVGIIETTGAVCGASATSLPVKGQGLGGIVGVSPATLDLGKVDCNSQPETQLLSVYNAGNLVYSWKAALKSGTNFTLSQSAGAVAPGASFLISIYPKALGMTKELGDNAFGDVLTVTTDVPGDLPHEVPIKQTAYGAILMWVTANTVDFGASNVNVKSPAKFFTLANVGNAAAQVKLSASAQFLGTSGTVAAGGGTFVSSVTYTPDNLGPQSGKLAISTDSPLCQESPGGLAVSGSGKGSAEAISMGGIPKNRGERHGGCVILANSGGRVACFGNNEFGQVGTATNTGPSIISELKDVVSLASGGEHNCAVDKAGAVWCWGNNRNRQNTENQQLGVSGVQFTAIPKEVTAVTGAIKVAIGHNLTCAVLGTGKVLCWGTNRRGNQGTGNSGSQSNPPTEVAGLTDITNIAVGGGGGCALRSDNTIWCWGREAHGNLGNCCGPQAMQVQNMGDAIGVSASTAPARGGSRCGLRMNGQVGCWGGGDRGQLGGGLNSRGSFQNPFDAQVNGTATAIAGFRQGECALMADKTIQCWGLNESGQVGDGTTFQHSFPTTVTGINDATMLAAGGAGACAIVTGGSVKCWGNYGAGSSSTPQALKYF